MEIVPRNVRNYVTPDGREPYEEWVNSYRNRKTRAIIRERINRLHLGIFGDYKRLTARSIRTENSLWSGLSGVSWGGRPCDSDSALWWI